MDVVAVGAALLGYVAFRTAMRRILSFVAGDRVVGGLIEAISGLISLSLAFAVLTVSNLGFIAPFILTFTLLLIFMLMIVTSVRSVLEEYLIGKVLQSGGPVYKIGDHLEVDGVRGYITRIDALGIHIRDTRRGIVFVPFTRLVNNVVRRFSTERGYEIHVRFSTRLSPHVERLRDEVERYMEHLGLEDPSVEIDHVEIDRVDLVARGALRDIRQAPEVRYAILEKVLKLVLENEAR